MREHKNEEKEKKKKIILIEVVKKDMAIKRVTESIIIDRMKWRKIIYVTYSN